ncbi:MAG: site-specific DNA-methyltransferase [Nanoarchaeota archaeon]|nr:site-specific DNA-methyltransferase [Nanoarchaeota archaeon]
MPVLNWIGKEAVANHDKEVPFRLLKKVKAHSVGENSQNLIIHGDNLHALKALMPYYHSKVKLVFIDPPYNTGNDHWVYNDKVNSPKIKKWLGKVVGRESEDLCRHDKWLCMIYPRLKLLKDLLSEDGVIFIAIDDNEQPNLKLVLDEIFGANNFVANIIWQHSIQPKGYSQKFSVHHNYILCYQKSDLFNLKALKRNESHNLNYSNPDNDPKGRWRPGDTRNALYRPNLIYDIVTPSGKIIKPPKKGWRWSKETVDEKINTGEIIFNKGETRIIRKIYLENAGGRAAETIFFGEDVGTTRKASSELKELFGDAPFETPKPIELIKRLIQISTDEEDIVLDSFSGSGTTGHAVLDFNKEEQSKRKFILIEMEDDVAKDITAERIKRAVKKYDYDDGFEYCELDKPLFDENGQIEDECTFNQFATYIYFTETQTNLDKKQIDKNFIGEHNEIDYYLIFKEKDKNVLNKAFLKKIKKNDNKKVIYADRCMIDEETLEKYNIQFKQIPYEVKVY